MRYREIRTKENKSNGLVLLQGWLNMAFDIDRIKRKKSVKVSGLDRLSHHLLDDLGFDNDLHPLSWSSYSPRLTRSARADRPAQKVCGCRHRSQCDHAVGCWG